MFGGVSSSCFPTMIKVGLSIRCKLPLVSVEIFAFVCLSYAFEFFERYPFVKFVLISLTFSGCCWRKDFDNSQGMTSGSELDLPESFRCSFQESYKTLTHPSPHDVVLASTRFITLSGAIRATCCAIIPPIEVPSIWARSIPK